MRDPAGTEIEDTSLSRQYVYVVLSQAVNSVVVDVRDEAEKGLSRNTKANIGVLPPWYRVERFVVTWIHGRKVFHRIWKWPIGIWRRVRSDRVWCLFGFGSCHSSS